MSKMAEHDKDIKGHAKEALDTAVGIMKTQDGSVSVKDKLTASRLVLDFTKEKPTQRTDNTHRVAEDFLDELAEEEESNAASDNEGREETRYPKAVEG